MQKRQNKVAQQRPLEERLRIAREINAYRAAHKGMKLADILKAMDLNIKESAYFSWNKRLELAEATRKANGNGSSEVESFPLSIIPERPIRTGKRGPFAPRPVEREDRTEVVASLLENLAKLLRR